MSNEWHIYAACLFPDLWLTNGFKRYPTENPDQFLEEQHLLLAAIIPNKNNKLVGRFRIPEKNGKKKHVPVPGRAGQPPRMQSRGHSGSVPPPSRWHRGPKGMPQSEGEAATEMMRWWFLFHQKWGSGI